MAREDFELARGEAVPLVLLPAPRVLREHALESMKRLQRPWKVSFTGSSMVSVQAAVSGIGCVHHPAVFVTAWDEGLEP
jgi:DNA-binding transcriptional LysR family regulator